MVKTETRPQVMYSVDIGSDNSTFSKKHKAVAIIASAVSEVTGGCTVIDGIGYWAAVERADKSSYTEYTIGRENNVQLQVKCEVEKEERLEEVLVKSTVKAAHSFPELGINWVCGHKVTRNGTTVAFNYSVKLNN